MRRLQLHITEHQDKQLRARARKLGQSRAELIRVAIDAWLNQGSEPVDPLMRIVGCAGRAGRSDLSESVDDILYGPRAAKLPQVAETDDT
jgi:Ribbon-helix-helix protein, copG family